MLLKVRSPYKLIIEEVLLFLYGFLGTMPILEIGGTSVFIYLTMLVVLWNVLLLFAKKNWEFSLQPICFPLILITVFSVISAVGCLLGNLGDEWKSTQMNKIVLTVLYLMIFLFYAQPERRVYLKNYIRGVYYACVFQMFWAYAQLLIQKSGNLSLNQLVFHDLLKMDVPLEEAWQNHLPGLCWHSSNMAPLLTFGFAMSKSPWLKLAFFVMSAICGSRTALIGVCLCAVIQWILYRKNFHGTVRVNGRTVKIAVIFAALACIAAGVSGIGAEFAGQLSAGCEKIMEMFQGTESSAGAHIKYWTSVPELIFSTDLVHVLIGYGIDCSGYTMAKLMGQYVGMQWVIECDYINVLWSNGLIGLILQFGWYFSQTARCGRTDKRYLTFLVPFFAMGVTYNVIYNWCMILLYCIFLLADSGTEFRDTIKMEECGYESNRL